MECAHYSIYLRIEWPPPVQFTSLWSDANAALNYAKHWMYLLAIAYDLKLAFTEVTAAHKNDSFLFIFCVSLKNSILNDTHM